MIQLLVPLGMAFIATAIIVFQAFVWDFLVRSIGGFIAAYVFVWCLFFMTYLIVILQSKGASLT